MIRAKINAQPSLAFADMNSGELLPDIWERLEEGLWKTFSIDNWMANDLLTPAQIDRQKNLFAGIQQIVPGTSFDAESGSLRGEWYKPSLSAKGMDRYLEIFAEYIDNLHARRIGVHLSGGLDSSLIIATLRHLNIPFVPIGAMSTTYEFRTERAVQNRLLEWGTDGELIDFNTCPYYSRLSEFPAMQIPSGIFKSFATWSRLADAFKAKGCDVVLGGQGGDSLFVDAIDDINDLTFNIGDEFEVSDEQEMVYGPRGMRLLSVFAHKPLIDFICTERVGQKDDPLKWWARKYFKDILPRELSEYAYFGDFFAMTMAGLDDSRPEIERLMSRAYDISSHEALSPKNIEKFLAQDIFSFEYGDYIRFCSLIAVSVWYNSLANAQIIK